MWLNEVLLRTISIFDYPRIMVDWERDSIIDILGYITIRPDYSPPVIEYKVYEGVIEDKTICKKMYFQILEFLKV
jgi:hypothetical protein